MSMDLFGLIWTSVVTSAGWLVGLSDPQLLPLVCPACVICVIALSDGGV
jgi:hypothetical protein